MNKIIQELLEIENLKRVAQFHKYHCKDSNCGVQLFYLKSTADRMARLVQMVYGSIEYNKAIKILEDFPL